MGTLLRLAWALPWLFPAVAQAMQVTEQPLPSADSGRDVLHTLQLLSGHIATALLLAAVLIVGYSIITLRNGHGKQPGQGAEHKRPGGWSWLVVPLLVLGVDLAIAGNGRQMLGRVWKVPGESALEVKVTGHQWRWEYEYPQSGVRLADADEAHLMLPAGRPVRLLHTSADVLHSFQVPGLGVIQDVIPGYVTETWLTPIREGSYQGHCSQLCGVSHSRMGFIVEVVSAERFDGWLAQRQVSHPTTGGDDDGETDAL